MASKWVLGNNLKYISRSNSPINPPITFRLNLNRKSNKNLNMKLLLTIVCCGATEWPVTLHSGDTLCCEEHSLIHSQAWMKHFSAGIYLFKVNNRNTRIRCEICLKLTIKILERRHWHRSGIFIVNFEHTSHLVLVFLLLTLNI